MYIPTACTCFARLRERGCAGGVGGGGGVSFVILMFAA